MWVLSEMLAPTGRILAFYNTAYYTENGRGNISITAVPVC